MKENLLSIIVPVYNEENTISEILKRIEKVDLTNLGVKKEVIIIDDGSTDGTRDILQSLENKYKIIYHSQNQGKGAALKTGFKETRGDYILIQDADLEYYPRDIPKLLNIALGEVDRIVYGSRNLNPTNPSSSQAYKFGGQLITLFFNLLFGQNLTDINTCYKLFPRECLDKIVLREERFAFCEEFTCQAVKKGYKIVETSICYSPRSFLQGKKIHWWHGFKSICVILKNRFF